MPIDYADYAEDWKAISDRIRFERAGGRCEGSPDYPDCRAVHGEPHPETGAIVVLTVAHLDHDPTNNADENLRAMCQRCHLTYDAKHHAANAARTRRRKREKAGQLPLLLLLLIFLIAACSPPFSQEPCNTLPCYRPGTKTYQVSSYDRSGLNADGTHYSIRRNDDTGSHVVLEETGPGTIHRIWATGSGLGQNIRIYLDDDHVPTVDVPVREFFSGQLEPFLYPLAGNDEVSSGGFYVYYPFTFQSLGRIEFDEVPQYYHATYHLYDGEIPDPIVPKMGAPHQRTSAPFSLDPGSSSTVIELDTPGTISEIALVLERPHDVKQTNIKIYWDGEEQPSIDTPAGYLFGLGSGGAARVDGSMFGFRPDTSTFYNTFPMPFNEQAKIVLANHSSRVLTGTMTVSVENTRYTPGYNAGYFAVLHRAEKPVTNGQPYTFADLAGRGHIVATILDVSNFYDWHTLEGDEMITIDGAEEPQIHGTGMEDFFNAGWYFNKGPFTLPTHGAPIIETVDGSRRVVAYRLHLADAITFEDGIHFTMEHGGLNDAADAHFESAVFLYTDRR